MKKIFISYNHLDTEVAKWVDSVVRDLGYDTILQEYDFGVGSNFVNEMHKATINSDHILCLLSENYLGSSFTAAEWMQGFSVDPLSEERVLIPIKVGRCKVQGLLGPIVYDSIVGINEYEAVEVIKNAIEGKSRPDSPLAFPKELLSDDSEGKPRKKSSQTISIVLDGTVSDEDADVAKRVAAYLASLLNDSTLKIRQLDPGSIILQLTGKFSTLTKLKRHYLLTDDFQIEGMKVLGLWLQDKVVPDPTSYKKAKTINLLSMHFRFKDLISENVEKISSDLWGLIAHHDKKYELISSYYFLHILTSRVIDELRSRFDNINSQQSYLISTVNKAFSDTLIDYALLAPENKMNREFRLDPYYFNPPSRTANFEGPNTKTLKPKFRP